MRIRLSKRLAAVGSLVTKGNILADIGCDHGYLPIYLISQRRIPRAIAMDVRSGPLSRARANIEAYGLLDYIEIRLSDGLEALEPKEAQTLVIAGMGGPLMEEILKKGNGTLTSAKELVLQPQSEVEHFRRFLQKLPFTVTEEEMVEEDGKYYPMMRLEAKRPNDAWGELDYRYGKYLLQKRHPVLKKYLHREKEKLEKLEKALRLADSFHAARRLDQIQREKKYVQEALKIYGFDM